MKIPRSSKFVCTLDRNSELACSSSDGSMSYYYNYVQRKAFLEMLRTLCASFSNVQKCKMYLKFYF